MRTPISKIYSLLLAVITGLSVSACVYEDMPDTPDEKEEQFGFCLRLVTSTPVTTRAVTDPYDEVGSINENMIDMAGGDFKVLLFSGAGDDAVLIDAPEFKISVLKDDYTEYIVWSRIPASFFKDNNINSDAEHDYQLMVLANWQSLGGSYPAVTPGTTTVASIKSSENRLLTGYNPDGWYPFENGKKGIPMYGLLPFKAKQSELYLHFDEDGKIVPNLETLYLLRAMAKLEIIDRTGEAFGNGQDNPDFNPFIESVQLSIYNTNGYLIPNQFQNGKQVSSPTIPVNSGSTLPGWWGWNGMLRQSGKVFTAYLLEKELNDYPTHQHDSSLKFIVRKKPNGESETFERKVSDIIQQNEYKEYFLRNHIYRIYVTLDIKTKIKLKYAVCPWGEKTTDIPTFD